MNDDRWTSLLLVVLIIGVVVAAAWTILGEVW